MSTLVKEIPLKGLSTSPSDYECPDGNLASAIGVVHEGGTIFNAAHTAPKILMDCGAESILFRHGTFDQDNIIYTNKVDDTTVLCYYKDGTGSRFVIDGSKNINILNIVSVGNTLIVYGDDGAHYFLWRDHRYRSLGTEIPDLDIKFGLEGETKVYYYKSQELIDGGRNDVRESESIITFGGDEVGWSFDWDDFLNIPLFVRNIVTEGVMARVGRFVSETAASGRFCMPFLVRYAYRMFDGSLIKHSAPVLMIPSTTAPIVPIHAIDPGHENYFFHVLGTSAALNYQVLNLDEISNSLKDWRDVVDNIEIYVSSPFYTYDQSGEVSKIVNDGVNIAKSSVAGIYQITITPENTRWHKYKHSTDYYSISSAHKFKEDRLNKTEWEKNFTHVFMSADKRNVVDNALCSINETFATNTSLTDRENSFRFIGYYGGILSGLIGDANDAAVFRDDKDINTQPCPFFFGLPEHPWGKIEKEAKECSNFYLIKELKIKELNSNINIVRLDSGELQNLETRQTMSDDYDSHDKKIPTTVSVYNNRVNMADIKSIKFDGYNFDTTQPRIDATTYTKAICFVTINNGNETLVLRKDSVFSRGLYNVNYFYYPDPKAISATIFLGNGSSYSKWVTLPLTEHKGLNGAVSSVTLGENILSNSSYTTEAAILSYATNTLGYREGNNTVTLHNQLYTSEVNNPFSFKAANVESLSNGRILALMPAAVALSEGQFGQFPMYAFTTDGIWSLSSNATGGWSAKQPVSRDVILLDRNNKPCILQLDQDIIFATDRGLMSISGSKVECISTLFDGTPDKFFSKYGEHIAKVLNAHTDITFRDQIVDDMFKPFREFISGGNMLYDYTHQRIILGNPDYKFCFILNEKDSAWTAEKLRIMSAINSYPECYAMIGEEEQRNLRLMVNQHALYEDPDHGGSVDGGVDGTIGGGNNAGTLPDSGSTGGGSTGGNTTPTPSVPEQEKPLEPEQTAPNTAPSIDGMKHLLVDFTQHDESGANNITMPADGYILTRPLKLDNPDTMKTIRTVVVRGDFNRANVNIIVYGSRDLDNWLLVGSAEGNRFVSRHGTPYKYFRVALITRLEKEESISGLTIEFETKETDKIR